MFFTLFIVFLIFITIIYGMGRLIDYITFRSGGILFGTGVLFLGAIRGAQFAIIWGLVTGVIGSIPFISFFWFIPFLITLYHLIFAFPLIFGPIMAMVSGYAGDEILAILPNFMLEYYQKNTPFEIGTLIGYNNREYKDKPYIFLVKEAWDYEDFLDAADKWALGELDEKPHFADYYVNES